MLFNKIKQFNIPYKDKVDGQIIDPVEWNANFLHIEQINDDNREIINDAFDGIYNDAGNTIKIKEGSNSKTLGETLDEITDAKYNGEVIISGTLVNDDSIGLFNQEITLTIGDEEVTMEV